MKDKHGNALVAGEAVRIRGSKIGIVLGASNIPIAMQENTLAICLVRQMPIDCGTRPSFRPGVSLFCMNPADPACPAIGIETALIFYDESEVERVENLEAHPLPARVCEPKVRTALCELVGATTREELTDMATVIRATGGAGEQVCLKAIDVLLETLPEEAGKIQD